MEVFIAQVPFFCSTHDLTRELAKIFHRPDYSPSMPLNFKVQLLSGKKRGQEHRGIGTLTLPHLSTAQKFLYEYGELGARSVVLKKRRLVFKPSNRRANSAPDPGVLEQVRSNPYLDPKVVEERERRDDYLNRTTVPLATIQFCWDCRDFVGSAEWELDCRGEARLSLDAEARQIYIWIPMPQAISGETAGIVIHFSQLFHVSIHKYNTRESVIWFSLNSAPSFEMDSPGSFTLPNQPPLRRRFPALPFSDAQGRPHSEVAPYTSRSLRLLTASAHGLAIFEAMATEANLPIPLSTDVWPLERRNLFSPTVLNDFVLWISQIPFEYAIELESLHRSLTVDTTELLGLRLEIEKTIREGRMRNGGGIEYVIKVLKEFSRRVADLYWSGDGRQDPVLSEFTAAKVACSKTSLLAKARQLIDEDLFMCLHATVTPSSIKIDGPYPERSNRVIRSYPKSARKHFLRVSFAGEDGFKIQSLKGIDNVHFVKQRFWPFLSEGIKLAGRRFFFLGYSQSALKEHTVWYLRPFKFQGRLIDVATVIKDLGSFAGVSSDPKLMHCPARYAARISQGFTTTDPTTTEVEEVNKIRDLETPDGKCYTDGVGTMSPEFARSIYSERLSKRRGRRRRLADYPRALQIRHEGSKGMLSVNHLMSGMIICIRDSMTKFIGTESRLIEIAKAFDRPGRFYLNRPLIVVLEALGVPYETFLHHQNVAVQYAVNSKASLDLSSCFLEAHGLGSSFRLPGILKSLSKLGLDNIHTRDKSFSTIMDFAINHVLRLIKHRSRIPVEGGYNLVGVADIHHYLKPHNIFACVNYYDGRPAQYLHGPVLISRSPVIHPGDVQLVHAIGPPPPGSPFEKEPLPNTVVFDTTGPRPVPSMLGGGDLDGDEYNLIPLKTLPEFTLRADQIQKPSEYETVPRKELDRPCEHPDVAQFVLDYLTSDVLGIVSMNWRIIADQSDEGIFHPDCLKLADLHSRAVDYPKSGNPVPINEIPKKQSKVLPDWCAPETISSLDPEKYYFSQSAIGRLHREIKLDPPESVRALGKQQRNRFSRERAAAIEEEIAEVVKDFESMFHTIADTADHDFGSLNAVLEDQVWQYLSNDSEIPDDPSDFTSLFLDFRLELNQICTRHAMPPGPGMMLTEEEAIVGTIVAKTSRPAERLQEIAKLRESTDMLVRAARESIAGAAENSPQQYLQRAYLAWKMSQVSLRRKRFGALSFSWVALGAIFEAIRDIENEEQEAQRRATRWVSRQ